MMVRTDVPVTALKTEVVTLTASLLEQMRILRVDRQGLHYDGERRILTARVWGREMDLPVLGYVWSPACFEHPACYWILITVPVGSVQRIYLKVDTRHHYDPPPSMEDVPHVFILPDGDASAPEE
ncbi:MAG: hypothetical protein A2Y74_05695 [Actinobacteria bacterium RBG_13_63_9]|nr:MAG: hypothetical protein A2Y74_05695 [Actinobacteria bacterium RBG_13_63_9]